MRKKTATPIRPLLSFAGGGACRNLRMQKRYRTSASPINTHSAKKVSRFRIPQWETRSALEKYFSTRASSMKPKTILRVVIHPPDFGKDCSQFGKRANSAKGSPSARPKPAMAKVSCTAPPFCPRAPTSSVPRMGPVQEKLTIARVRAIKKIPPRLPIFDLESTELETLLGRVISKRPKKESAKAKKIAAKRRFSQILVEMLLRTLALLAFRK